MKKNIWKKTMVNENQNIEDVMKSLTISSPQAQATFKRLYKRLLTKASKFSIL